MSNKKRGFAFGQKAKQRKKNRSLSDVRLQIEPLEDRRVLATVLEGITTNEGNLLDLDSPDTLLTSPSELTLVFGRGDLLSPTELNGITLVRGGADQVLGTADDITVETGFVGIGDSPNKAIVRFAENLPDDVYEIQIGTETLPAGEQNVRFNVDLGARVVGVVPQPTTRLANGTLSQARDQIVVYFNNDNLDSASAQNPAFYQLIFTGHGDQFDGTFDTVNNLDDGTPILPTSVSYDSVSDSATLTFSADIEDLAGGAGTYRLRIGTNEAVPLPPVSVDPTSGGNDAEAGQIVSQANTALGTLTDQSQIISGFIDTPANDAGIVITPAGGENDPGHRIATGRDQHVFGSDLLGIATLQYNFGPTYRNPVNVEDPPALTNQITDSQKELARQVFDVFSYYYGIQFEETESDGFIIATGNEVADDAFVIIGSNFDESYGGDWFQQAMFQIGFGLGFGIAEDLPEGTIMGGPDGAFGGAVEDSFSADQRLTFGREAEPVFPGDHDIVHGQHVYRATADDVDMYQFTLTEPGVVSLETFAERSTSASHLDTVLRLFQGENDPVLLAQNDDYFGNDSFVEVELQPGTYYVGVSSTGNDSYDPAFPTFTGGRTEGSYDLRVDFRSTADNSIVDTTGRRLDGDGDGIAGGVHNFWFRAEAESNTLFVDKAASSGGNGSLASPYNNLQTAMSAASEGNIVRVVGNNFGDGNATNDQPYEIGISGSGSALPDGGVDGLLRIRKGVTLMIDAGSVFKMRRGAIIAGSDSPLIDNSGGAIQILGTPNEPVVFTSLNDESIGTDNNPSIPNTPAKGDWGGIIIRNDASRAAGQFDYEAQGIFLNYVNQADMRYGGGVLSLNSVSQAVNAVTLIDARPTVTNNSITQSMDAPIAASPNSFEESNFRAPEFQLVAFTPDYRRIGPDIGGNVLVDNETNGLSIVNRSISFDSTLSMSVSGRFDDTDIVHVISDNLTIESAPGGVFSAGGVSTGSPAGRLAIDPGTVVKLDGGVIEVGFGATLLAEGTAEKPVVFTSVFDSRFGGGGTFDTDIRTNSAQAGDWGGVFLGPTSRGSFDHNIIAYGGGEAPIEGNLAGFNAIEVYQADARITHSTIEFNANGRSTIDVGNRFGRGANEAGTIFVRGAQPIVVGNYFHDNEAAIVNINVNALNHFNVQDIGRQTGDVDRIGGFLDNQGPLVRDNVLDRNGINGMEVRGGTLTTESVWDDTDVVHVVRDGVYVPNFHSFGGLRLKSSQTESLVVKLDGPTAGFITTGSEIGIPDHIGGSIQVLGQPGRPVVLTSLFDDTVGAGVDSSGATQADTNNGGRPVRTIPLRTEDNPGGFEIAVNYGPNNSRKSWMPSSLPSMFGSSSCKIPFAS